MPNEATNFRECVLENLRTVLLGQGHFEESVTWFDAGESEGRTITVNQVNAVGNLGTEQHHLVTGHTLHFLVESHETRGTLAPAIGCRLVREDGSNWGFQRVISSDQAGWILEFVGGQIDRSGMGRQAHL